MSRPADRSGEDLYVPAEWEADAHDPAPPPRAELSLWSVASYAGKAVLVGLAILVGAVIIAWIAEGVGRVIWGVFA